MYGVQSKLIFAVWDWTEPPRMCERQGGGCTLLLQRGRPTPILARGVVQ